jgi:hypothetical protein
MHLSLGTPFYLTLQTEPDNATPSVHTCLPDADTRFRIKRMRASGCRRTRHCMAVHRVGGKFNVHYMGDIQWGKVKPVEYKKQQRVHQNFHRAAMCTYKPIRKNQPTRRDLGLIRRVSLEEGFTGVSYRCRVNKHLDTFWLLKMQK